MEKISTNHQKESFGKNHTQYIDPVTLLLIHIYRIHQYLLEIKQICFSVILI